MQWVSDREGIQWPGLLSETDTEYDTGGESVRSNEVHRFPLRHDRHKSGADIVQYLSGVQLFCKKWSNQSQ